MSRNLTQAERALVEAAALGLSNRELAERRRTTEQTVANQLTIAYRKLGVASRRELRALLGTSNPKEQPRPEPPRSLTPREWTMLCRVEEGLSNKLIAHTLGVSISTVATTLTRGRRKLGARGTR